MRIRNLRPLTANHYYDDKAWLALALQRVANTPKIQAKLGTPRELEPLVENIFEGVDSLTGVLPWRTQETFYNVPTNGPAAILAARNGDIETAERLINWTFDNLINEDGLVMDGIHMRMAGPEPVTAVHPYCQGVMIGACVELALARRRAAGVEDRTVSDVGVKEITRIHGLLARSRCTSPTATVRSVRALRVETADCLMAFWRAIFLLLLSACRRQVGTARRPWP